MSCIVCGKNGGKLFNVFTSYGNVGYTVFDDVSKIYGNKAVEVLKPDDNVCNICMMNLETIAKIKSRIWMLLTNRENRRGNIKRELWSDSFLRLIDLCELDKIDRKPDVRALALNVPRIKVEREDSTDSWNNNNSIATSENVREADTHEANKRKNKIPASTNKKGRRAAGCNTRCPSSRMGVLSEAALKTPNNVRSLRLKKL